MTHSSRDRRLRASAVAACTAALLLAGCDTDPGVLPEGATAAAEPAPIAVPAADPAAPQEWKGPAYRALGCTTRAAWVAGGLPADAWEAETVRSSVADVTGDGADEVLVQLRCPSPASTQPFSVVVLDVTGGAPTPLGVLGGDLFFTQATVTTAGTTVTLDGPTVAGDDPTCCPTHLGTVTYAWDGVGFVVRTRSEVALESIDAP